MNENKILKLGLIGCGRISTRHFDAIKNNPNFEIVSVCDNQKQILENIKLNEKVKKFTSLEKMLSNVNIDVLTVCTPNSMHSKNTIAAAQNGINVLAEKPMAIDINNANLMLNACKENFVNLMIVLPFRNYKLLNLVKSKIDNNSFGKIHLINTNIFWTRPQSYYDESPWRGTVKHDGGILLNQVIHYIDLLYYLFGKPSEIQAFNTKFRQIQTDDSSVINLKWSGSFIASINITMLTYPSNLEDSLTIIGEKGTVKINSISKGIIELWSFKDEDDIDNNVKELDFSIDYENGHKNIYNQFYQECLNKNFSYKTAIDSIEVLDFVESILQSNNEKKIINL